MRRLLTNKKIRLTRAEQEAIRRLSDGTPLSRDDKKQLLELLDRKPGIPPTAEVAIFKGSGYRRRVAKSSD